LSGKAFKEEMLDELRLFVVTFRIIDVVELSSLFLSGKITKEEMLDELRLFVTFLLIDVK